MRARLRAVLLLGWWIALIAVIAPFVIALRLLTGNENYIYKPVRWGVRLGLRMVRVRVEASGIERIDPKRTYVFTPNHQSLLEVPLLLLVLPHNVAYLAKRELFKYPVFGYGMKLVGVVPVDRSNTQAAVESARAATERLRQGKSYVVYPEGTRSPSGRLLTFKKGAFLMALEAEVPIVPISISGSAAIMPKAQMKVYPSTVRVTIHDPIETRGVSKDRVSTLIEKARSDIRSGLSESER